MPLPTAAYLICTNPRSGSWLLSEGLSATAVAGHPREWFQAEEQRDQAARWGLGPDGGDALGAEYLRRVLDGGTTPNGVFGAKVMYYQMADLPRRVATGDSAYRHGAARFPGSMLPGLRYLWLRRRDAARQAISYARAAQTDVWWQIDGATPAAPRAGVAGRPTFDPHGIARLEREVVQGDALWRRYFGDLGVTPLEVHYEALAADYASEIRRVLAWLGVGDGPATRVRPPRLRRQADELSEEWVRRYAVWKAGRDASADDPAATRQEVRPAMQTPQTPPREVDAEWSRWVAENVLLDKEPGSIVRAMVGSGIDPSAAAAEVDRAIGHPYIKAARQWGGKAAPGSPPSEAEAKLRKRDWVLACLGKLARLSPASAAVPRVRTPSRQAFLDDHYAANRPVVIEGAMDDWPAVDAWTLPELKRRLGDRTIEAQRNRDADPDYERHSARLRHRMPFGEYVDAVANAAGPTNDLYVTANNAGVNRDALRPLWDDVGPLAEYLRADPANPGFFWFGPAGTVTPLHHDLTNNFMAQVVGRKRVLLIPPAELPRLYNDRHCYSQVDPLAPDLGRHPLFADVAVADVVIGPRDLLFLPVGWWHHVRSLDVSITVTFTNFVFDNDFASMYPHG